MGLIYLARRTSVIIHIENRFNTCLFHHVFKAINMVDPMTRIACKNLTSLVANKTIQVVLWLGLHNIISLKSKKHVWQVNRSKLKKIQ